MFKWFPCLRGGIATQYFSAGVSLEKGTFGWLTLVEWGIVLGYRSVSGGIRLVPSCYSSHAGS